MKNLKVGVYCICKNEEKFLLQFLENVKAADEIVICDTGSTDDTMHLLNMKDIRDQYPQLRVFNITVRPWRFDVPRNVALSLLGQEVDIAVSVDLDEKFNEGWVQKLKEQWKPGQTQMRYFYSWSHNEDGSPATSFWYEKIHSRHNFKWVKPVHEVLKYLGAQTGPELVYHSPDIRLDHWPDPSKSRAQYLHLLEVSVKEEPEDDRNAHYLGREYMYLGEYEKAIAELKRHLDLKSSVWKPERAASMRFIGRSYTGLGNVEEAEKFFRLATEESPDTREPWYEYGLNLHNQKKWEESCNALIQCLEIKERPTSYICDPSAWSYHPLDLMALNAYYLGHYPEAAQTGKLAIEEAEKTAKDQLPRLIANLEFYEQKI